MKIESNHGPDQPRSHRHRPGARREVPAGGPARFVCGRREDKAARGKQRHPRLHTRICDVSNEADRPLGILAWATPSSRGSTCLVNNAGVWSPAADRPGPGPLRRIHQGIRHHLEARSTFFAARHPAPPRAGVPVIVACDLGAGLRAVASVPQLRDEAALHSFRRSPLRPTAELGPDRGPSRSAPPT